MVCAGHGGHVLADDTGVIVCDRGITHSLQSRHPGPPINFASEYPKNNPTPKFHHPGPPNRTRPANPISRDLVLAHQARSMNHAPSETHTNTHQQQPRPPRSTPKTTPPPSSVIPAHGPSSVNKPTRPGSGLACLDRSLKKRQTTYPTHNHQPNPVIPARR